MSNQMGYEPERATASTHILILQIAMPSSFKEKEMKHN